MGPPSLQRLSCRPLVILRTQEGWMIRVRLPPLMIKAVAVVALLFYTSHLNTKVMRVRLANGVVTDIGSQRILVLHLR